ncbi:MAG TPA: peptidase M42 [Elusimicrobia bacterium]|nr:MAG: peptidase M42 [Elusimicrobia bacterium RIFOXYA12_FULL_49_49]OGS09390.1 MAG: peptidase M42 [Elusimicrobia bacterium RIFOXYA1_FULL_47_7]OGS11165.1 MAG: peptidase M42 [Elusimicrobia bacterium RIFOXYB1_FULL_48_9]OGS14950.1 MAG: peptidase M42 [Elusimicrobia bacterium RIFOXYA2_FULL_47_53]OGS26115.1 MAG: peptidase M42 [Elusimicrobia bacterium RIFOXYB12_FULL_50_12]OGS29295.1 MAG: peptidase M42 [Elusimicrobia bacterium RIFOXYB2_FULL_46_23]HBU70353.1 peptidase M42 [Elusimicrobiota bacterium]
MDELLIKMLSAAGISGYESEISAIMESELKKSSREVTSDDFGNIIAKKGSGKRKIMLAAHMDEVGLMVKYISKEGFISFIKVGGIDDRVLVAQRVVVKTSKGDVTGIIGSKPPHLQKDEERKKPVKYEEMFIDIGAKSREEALSMVSIGDPVVFDAPSGVLNGKLCYGKAADNRVGCYILLKVMEKLKADAEVYAVATAQEEVGLKGSRVSAFGIDPDFALAIDTTVAGDTPQIQERESSLKLGSGVAITIIEASGRGVIVGEKMKSLLIKSAKDNKIKYQMDVIEGGVTDGAMIQLNRSGVLTGVLSVPCRYIHSPNSVFHLDDVNSAVNLTIKAVEKLAKL